MPFPFTPRKSGGLPPRSMLLLLPLLLLASGCATQTYRKGMDKIHPAYAMGDFDAALAVTGKQIAGKPDDATKNNMLVWRLNHAALLAASGRHQMAEDQWDILQPVFEHAWQNDRVHIIGDSVGLLVPGVKDTYYAKPHEGIMVYTCRMVNALLLGDLDEAARHLAAARDFRAEVLQEMEKRVEKRREKGITDDADFTRAAVSDGLAEKNNANANTTKDESLGVSNALLAKVNETRLAEVRADLAGYDHYANPLTALLTHILLRTHGTGLAQTDQADAEKELEDLQVFAPNNSAVRSLSMAEPLANTVFVFFETGLAPRQEEMKITVPLPPVTKWFPSAWGVAYPRLVANPDYVPHLFVTTSGQSRAPTEPLVNFDAIVQQSFDDAWPGVIARQITQSIVTTVINAALNYAGNKAAEKINNGWIRIIVQIFTWGGTAALSYAMTEADTRSWELLPKQVQVARFDIPADRELTLSLPNSAWRETLTLGDGDVLGVWVKSTSPRQPAPLATPFRFK